MVEFTSSVDGTNERYEFVAKNGMKIRLGEPNIMETLTFANVLTYGKDGNGNSLDRFGNILSSVYLGSMHALLAVKEIDGLPQPPITNKVLLEALEKKLGDALSEVVNAYLDMQTQASANEGLEEVKK